LAESGRRAGRKGATYSGGAGGLRVLHQVPDFAAQARAAVVEVLGEEAALFGRFFLFAYFFENVLFAVVVAEVAAGLEVALVDAPVLQVVVEGHDAAVVQQVQLGEAAVRGLV